MPPHNPLPLPRNDEERPLQAVHRTSRNDRKPRLRLRHTRRMLRGVTGIDQRFENLACLPSFGHASNLTSEHRLHQSHRILSPVLIRTLRTRIPHHSVFLRRENWRLLRSTYRHQPPKRLTARSPPQLLRSCCHARAAADVAFDHPPPHPAVLLLTSLSSNPSTRPSADHHWSPRHSRSSICPKPRP